MNDLTIYTMLSHTDVYRECQHQQLLACFNPMSIVTVLDPNAHVPVPANLARILIRTRELNQKCIRMEAISDWVMNKVLPAQATRYALLLHGDIFPMRSMSIEELLRGKPLAGRGGFRLNGCARMDLAWFLVDTTQQFYRAPVCCWPAEQTTIWRSRKLDGGEGGRVPGLVEAGYRGELGFEWLEPCFLHADKMALSSLYLLEKGDVIARLFGCKPGQFWNYSTLGGTSKAARKLKGVGDHLHDLILQWTLAGPTTDCGCASMMARMNCWGVDGCLRRTDRIVRYLLRQARKRGWKLATWPGAKLVARQMVASAIGRAEEDV